MLPVAQSASDSVVICYILPILWMMLCFHVMGPVGRIKHDVMFRRVCQVAVPAGVRLAFVYYLQLPRVLIDLFFNTWHCKMNLKYAQQVAFHFPWMLCRLS